MNGIITFSGFRVFAAFAKENRSKFGEFSPRLDDLIKASNLFDESCCGVVKGSRKGAAEAAYLAIVKELKDNPLFLSTLKSVGAICLLRFENNGTLVDEL